MACSLHNRCLSWLTCWNFCELASRFRIERRQCHHMPKISENCNHWTWTGWNSCWRWWSEVFGQKIMPNFQFENESVSTIDWYLHGPNSIISRTFQEQTRGNEAEIETLGRRCNSYGFLRFWFDDDDAVDSSKFKPPSCRAEEHVAIHCWVATFAWWVVEGRYVPYEKLNIGRNNFFKNNFVLQQKNTPEGLAASFDVPPSKQLELQFFPTNEKGTMSFAKMGW